ncbi:hypothetical protein [Jannaschia rubra]|uniref:hypothetical protein n=1 Tax=Jannaschia rubra TaxID=282197 RepID=UPI0006E21653|nr:hypothetical protein [Jannaschia rubra]
MGDHLDEGARDVLAIEAYAADHPPAGGGHETVVVVSGRDPRQVDVVGEQARETGVRDARDLTVEPVGQKPGPLPPEQPPGQIGLRSEGRPVRRGRQNRLP